MIDLNTYRHMKSPRGFGKLEAPDFVGVSGNPNRVGPFFQVYLQISDGVISKMQFETYRCAWSMASGSILASLIEGRSVEEAAGFGVGRLQAEMGDVPPSKIECLSHAVEALKDALAQVAGKTI